jgi:hypothetical protein
MSSDSQKATSFILSMGMVWMATSESKSMACSKSDDVNVGDPIHSTSGRRYGWTSVKTENTQTVNRKSDRAYYR